MVRPGLALDRRGGSGPQIAWRERWPIAQGSQLETLGGVVGCRRGTCGTVGEVLV
jgi:hypothetical protein